jgi:hypothetical protein
METIEEQHAYVRKALTDAAKKCMPKGVDPEAVVQTILSLGVTLATLRWNRPPANNHHQHPEISSPHAPRRGTALRKTVSIDRADCLRLRWLRSELPGENVIMT